MVDYPIIYKVLYIQTVVGLGISEPSTVCLTILYEWSWLTLKYFGYQANGFSLGGLASKTDVQEPMGSANDHVS